jgi:aspartate carbamoyltransferase catalytic subunit
LSGAAWAGRDVLSVLDFARPELEALFQLAESFSRRPDSVRKSLTEKIVATAFFEASTRTRLSFATAALKLGANVIDLSPDVSSVQKGESLHDTIKMLESYSDVIVMRHPSEGAALLASEISSSPVINGGDGSQHHPSQAMLDLFTIRKLKGGIDGLRYAVVGDIRYARTATSFLYGLTKYRPGSISLVAPESLRPRGEVQNTLRRLGAKMKQFERLDDVVEAADVIYLTRIQKERFPDPNEYEKVKGSYKLTRPALARMKKGGLILHPLPRTDELGYDVDGLPSAAYMKQAAWGVPLRMAILHKVLGEKPE